MNQKRSLELFISNNNDLEFLEDRLKQFNFFEVTGMRNYEIKHSCFLSYILNPLENHGLSNTFLKKFIKSVLLMSEISLLSPIDIDFYELNNVNVLREKNDIDILILDEVDNLCIVIENKVDSRESENQLKKYHDYINDNYGGYKKNFIFLTKNGDDPTHKAWIPVTYNLIFKIIKDILTIQSKSLGTDIVFALEQYNELIARYFMDENDIVNLCQKIYQKHKIALDLIFENKPDVYHNIKNHLINLINNNQNLSIDNSNKSHIKFSLTKWDDNEHLRKGDNSWSNNSRILLFEFQNNPKGLNLKLIIGPGEGKIREAIHTYSKKSELFKTSQESLTVKFAQIFSFTFLTKNNIINSNSEELFELINKKWDEFKKVTIKNIENEIDNVLF